jgi:hypothetical protein
MHYSRAELNSDHSLMREPELQDWVSKMKPEDKKAYPMTEEISLAIDRFYFNHYCQSFRSGAFARANSSMYDICATLCLISNDVVLDP